MKVLAKQTISEVKNIYVEVDPKSILHEIYWEALKDKPPKAKYIRDGHWYVFSFTDYHKGTDEYKKDRAVTPEESKIYEAYLTMRELLWKI